MRYLKGRKSFMSDINKFVDKLKNNFNDNHESH